MQSNRIVAFALTATVVLGACGGGGGNKAATSDSTSPSSSTSSSSGQSAQAKKAADALQQAHDVAKKAGDVVFGQEQDDYAAKDVDALKADVRNFRDIDFTFDKAVRAIDFPAEAANEVNAFLTNSGGFIAAEDAVQAATTVVEFHQLERVSLRAGVGSVEARMALQRKLGAPDPGDPGEPKNASSPGGTVVFTDDFSDTSSGWSTGSSPQGTFGYQQGKYVLTVSDALQGAVGSDSTLEGSKRDPKLESLNSVSVSATATKLQDVGGNLGLTCHEKASPFSGYIASIDTTGDWVIGRGDGTAFKELTNDNGSPTRGVSSVIKKDENDLRMDCVSNGGSVTVTLFVNGKQIAAGTDKGSALAPGAVGFTVDTTAPVCCNSAAFDDIEIRDLS
jgi:hypothetical protein